MQCQAIQVSEVFVRTGRHSHSSPSLMWVPMMVAHLGELGYNDDDGADDDDGDSIVMQLMMIGSLPET